MTSYPAQIDNSLTLPIVIDNVTPLRASIINDLRNAVIAVEAELGTNPKGSYSNVKGRLDTLENTVGNLKIIDLDGDLGGTLSDPKVIAIQGFLLSDVEPQVNQILTWNGLAWEADYPKAGIEGVAFGKDLIGTAFEQTVIGLQGRQLASTLPTINQTIAWSGTRWEPRKLYSQSLLSLDFDLQFNLISSSTKYVEVGQTVTNPEFSISYNHSPDSVALQDSDNLTNQDVTGDTTFSSDYSFVKSNFGQLVLFTLTASKDEFTKSDTASLVWGQKIYYGTSSSTDSNEAFVKALGGFKITASKDAVLDFSASSGEYIYIGIRTDFGSPTYTVDNLIGGFTLISDSISLTNDYGYTENYSLYASDNTGLGDIQVTIS